MDPEEDLQLLTRELRALTNEALISIVKNPREDNILRLQAAWETLAERGISEQVLNDLTEEDKRKQLSLSDLTDPENDEEVSDDSFAEKVEFIVGSEIPVNHRDILGVLKNPTAKEEIPAIPGLTEEEKIQLRRRYRQQLTMSAFSFLFVIVCEINMEPSVEKFIVQSGLIIHSFARLFIAFSSYYSTRERGSE